jgi:hypothetical protein
MMCQLLILWALMSQAVRDAPPTGTRDTSSVSGIVMSATDRPLRRAVISIVGPSLTTGRSAVSDDEGRFVIDALPSGRFAVVASKPGYITTELGAQRPGQGGTSIVVGQGQAITGLRITVPKGAAVAGRVVDAGGVPVQSAVVSVFQRYEDGTYSPQIGSAPTDDLGDYRVFGLPPGTFIVAASPRTGMLPRDMRDYSDVEIDLLLAALRGRSDAAVGRTGRAPELSEGRRITAVPIYYPGVATVQDATHVSLGQGDELSRLDIRMLPISAHSVQGVIVPVVPPGYDEVTIVMAPFGAEPPVTLGRPGLVQKPGADGIFAFANVAPGRYSIECHAKRGEDVWWGRAETTVAGDMSGVTVAMVPATALHGRIHFTTLDGRLPPDPTSLQVVASPVVAFAGNLRSIAAASLRSPLSAPVKKDGTFEIRGLVGRRYRIDVRGLQAHGK